MREHKFKIFLFLILLLGLGVRLFAIRNNYFYFTMDQGRDAVYVRDILHGHHTLLGPHASIKGIFTGPLWFYFLSIGFLLSGGHPAAGPILLIITQLATIAGLAFVLRKTFGENRSPLVALLVIISPSFFEASIYAFNPFLLPILTLISILALIKVNKNNLYFLLANFAAGMVIHAQIASLLPLALTTVIYGIYLVYKKKLDWEYFVFGLIFLGLPFIPHLISELQTDFSQLKSGINAFQNHETGLQIASGNELNQFLSVGKIHLELIGKTLVPSHTLLGLSFAIISTASYLKLKLNKNDFVKKLIILTSTLTLFSWIWFSLSTGLNDWHLLGLPTLFLLTFCLITLNLPHKIATALFSLLLFVQIIGLMQRIVALESEHDDQSMLNSELAAIDWIYAENQNKSFEVYSYLPSVKDYPYQYLFWWRGRKKYNYLPCKYAADPLGSNSYVPHAYKYQQASRKCSGIVYLIIEPALQQSLQDNWYKRVSKNTQLVNSARIGKIKLEKRKRN
ncbi:MAG: hypothetical protein ABFQ62_01765 [Patescibacteria group bacterium]